MALTENLCERGPLYKPEKACQSSYLCLTSREIPQARAFVHEALVH